MLIDCLKVLTCQLEPSLKGIELNLADNTIISVLSRFYNVGPEKIKEEYKKCGDLALVAKSYFQRKGDNGELEISQLIESLRNIAEIKGKGSKEQKEDLLLDIFYSLKTEHEIYFLVKFLQVVMSTEKNSYSRKTIELACLLNQSSLP